MLLAFIHKIFDVTCTIILQPKLILHTLNKAEWDTEVKLSQR